MFIPLLLMGGIIGRLFREFALTVTASIAVSALVSLTLAPMLCSRFMRPETHAPGRIHRAIESMFDGMLLFYQRTLDVVLRHQAITLAVFFATMALTGVMMYRSRRAFSRSRTSVSLPAYRKAPRTSRPRRCGASNAKSTKSS